MTGQEFIDQFGKIQKALAEIRTAPPPTTWDELNDALANLQKEAPDAATFTNLPPDKQNELALRLIAVQRRLESYADGSPDPKSVMHKEHAGNWTIWILALLGAAVALALVVNICDLWGRATKSTSPCNLVAGGNKSATGKPVDADKAKPAAAPGAAPSTASPPAATPPAAAPSAGAATTPPAGTTGGGAAPPPQKDDKTPEVTPSQASLSVCDSVPLQIPGYQSSDITWNQVPTGSIGNDGIYKAPSSIAGQQTISVGAQVKTGADKPVAAKPANITLLPPGGPDEMYVVIMIALMGALGGSVRWISGFVFFVGNRTFFRSWVVYYLLLPFEGAALAVIVYMLFRAGIVSPSSVGGQTTASLNTVGLYAVAGLTGLFSKQTLEWLKTVSENLFKPMQAKDSKPDAKPATDTKAAKP